MRQQAADLNLGDCFTAESTRACGCVWMVVLYEDLGELAPRRWSLLAICVAEGDFTERGETRQWSATAAVKKVPDPRRPRPSVFRAPPEPLGVIF